MGGNVWEQIGARFLEGEHRPTLLLTPDGQLLGSNALMRNLVVGVEHATSLFDVVHAPRLEDDLRRVSEGALRRLRVETRGPGELSLVCEASVLGAPVTGVLLSVVETVTAPPDGPVVPAHGTTYDVSLSSDGTPSRVLRATVNGKNRAVDPNEPCHRFIAGREHPCTTCPVSSGHPRARLVVSEPFQAELVRAVRTEAQVARVSVTSLDSATFSELVQVRLEALARKGELTQKEKRVLALIMTGLSLGDIAEQEGVTPRTAKYHQQNLLRKLGAESRVDLLRLLS